MWRGFLPSFISYNRTPHRIAYIGTTIQTFLYLILLDLTLIWPNTVQFNRVLHILCCDDAALIELRAWFVRGPRSSYVSWNLGLPHEGFPLISKLRSFQRCGTSFFSKLDTAWQGRRVAYWFILKPAHLLRNIAYRKTRPAFFSQNPRLSLIDSSFCGQALK